MFRKGLESRAPSPPALIYPGARVYLTDGGDPAAAGPLSRMNASK